MNVSIRAWQEEDALSLQHLSMHPYFTKERIIRYFYPDTFLNAMSMIYFYQSADPQRFLFRAVVVDEKVVGYISAEVKKKGSCEVSYWLGHGHWRQGIMSRAVKLMCEECYDLLGVLCIYAIVEDKNIASQCVLEKNKFQREAVEHFFIYRLFK